VCGASPLGTTRLALSGCAVAEPGIFSTGADNTVNPRSHTRAWLALGAAAELSLRLAAWLILRAGAELLAPLRRDHMSLAGDIVYRTPRLGSRLQIGIEIPFG
jgi:Na+-transporting NADH:ubiquinone oxidoreductase subunit NqrB